MGGLIALAILAALLLGICLWLYVRSVKVQADHTILLSQNASLEGRIKSLGGDLEDNHRQLAELRNKYSSIDDVERELERRRSNFESTLTAGQRSLEEVIERRDHLSASYLQAKQLYDKLSVEVSKLEENLEDISFGLYKPHYTFATADEYRLRFDSVREQRKVAVRDGSAAICPVEWSVGGNKRDGARMVKQLMKVMLRAFNGECEAALAKVAWNNVTKMEHRLIKSYEAINELGSVNQVSITASYLELSLAELRLSYEYAEKRHDEQEEERRIREQLREEERARLEYERAQKAAESEEERYQKALARARDEMERASGEALSRLNEKVSELEHRLAEAQARRERAISMAQQTRSGHVYVISNLGSFGEDVYKIGLTRRLEPEERVNELGGASVPFPFDIHAMIYSTDAPALEHAFHRHFSDRRLNLVNVRKEFFRVTLDEIEEFAKLHHGVPVQFIRLAEARHYRETLALQNRLTTGSADGPAAEFPAEIWPTSPFDDDHEEDSDTFVSALSTSEET